MKNGEKADLGAQMFGVSGDGAQGLGCGSEENAVDRFLVLVSDGGNLFRQGEDDVEVWAVEQFGLAVLQPLDAGQRLTLGAMAVTTGVETDPLVATLIALFDMAAESCGAAPLDGAHDPPLGGRHRGAMLLAINVPIAAEDIRHL